MCALTNGTSFPQAWTQFYFGVSQMVSCNGHVVSSVAFAVCHWEWIQIAMRIAVCVTLHCGTAGLQQTALAFVGFENRQQRLVTCIARGPTGEPKIPARICRSSVNPSTPELNPSAQRCLPRFFTGILIFKGFTVRRLYK
jgi:hypothetical protein